MKQGSRTAQKGADMAREGFERSTRAAEEGIQAADRSYGAVFDNMSQLHTKLVEIAQQHTQIGLDFVTDLTAARSPADLVQVWTSYTGKQFEMLMSHAKQLAELNQRFATESMQPIIRSAARTVSDEEI